MKATNAVLCCALLLAPSYPLQAESREKIQKCQDAQGRWHYGEHAAAECAADKGITILDESGMKLKEQRPPPTGEELKLRKEEEDRKKEAERQAAAARASDQKLLHTYDSEETLMKARDSQLGALDAQLAGYRKLLEGRYAQRDKLLQQLATLQGKAAESTQQQLEAIKAEIAEFEAATAQREKERARIAERFETDLARYRELKKRQAAP